jgi:hypothetical protein
MNNNTIAGAFPAYDFSVFTDNGKKANEEYVSESYRLRQPVREDARDAKIVAEAAIEAVNINEWASQNGELIPQILEEREKAITNVNKTTVKERNKIITEGEHAERELPRIQKEIDVIERQLNNMTPVNPNGSIYLKWWFPWVILLVVVLVDCYVLFNQFLEMRFSIPDSIVSTIGVILAVDLLVPLSLVTFLRARVEKTKTWLLTPVFLILAALIVTLTFVSVSERNENVRNNLATQIQQAEENGDMDGTLAALTKAYEELPTSRQIFAKGLIPVVTSCVSLAVFVLNIPGNLYLEKQKTLKKRREYEEKLEGIKKDGKEADSKEALLEVFDREADEAMLQKEKEELHQHAQAELREIVSELKEHFRLTLRTTAIPSAR